MKKDTLQPLIINIFDQRYMRTKCPIIKHNKPIKIQKGLDSTIKLFNTIQEIFLEQKYKNIVATHKPSISLDIFFMERLSSTTSTDINNSTIYTYIFLKTKQINMKNKKLIGILLLVFIWVMKR